MTTHTPAQERDTVLTDAQIDLIRIRAEKDSRRSGRTVDIPIRADLLLALLSKLRAPVAMIDTAKLAQLLDSVNGDFYLGKEKEEELVQCLRSQLRAPVADERAAFEAIVKRLSGDCTWRPGYGYVSSMTRLYQNFWQLAHVARGSK